MNRWLLAGGGALLVALAAFARQDKKDDPITTYFCPAGEKRGVTRAIARLLRDAKKEIVVAMFHFTSKDLAAALGDVAAGGVKVRLLLDAGQIDTPGDAEEDRVVFMKGKGVEVRRVTPSGSTDTPARFHHKFAVIDGATIITGSYNWTFTGETRNHENVVVIRDGQTAQEFLKTFEAVWNDPAITK